MKGIHGPRCSRREEPWDPSDARDDSPVPDSHPELALVAGAGRRCGNRPAPGATVLALLRFVVVLGSCQDPLATWRSVVSGVRPSLWSALGFFLKVDSASSLLGLTLPPTSRSPYRPACSWRQRLCYFGGGSQSRGDEWAFITSTQLMSCYHPAVTYALRKTWSHSISLLNPNQVFQPFNPNYVINVEWTQRALSYIQHPPSAFPYIHTPMIPWGRFRGSG